MGLIRSIPTYVRSKVLISAEAKKSPIPKMFLAYFHLALSLGYLYNKFGTKKVHGQVTMKANHTCEIC